MVTLGVVSIVMDLDLIFYVLCVLVVVYWCVTDLHVFQLRTKYVSVLHHKNIKHSFN